MTDSHFRSPQDDLEQRRPVWDALSELFLDTQLSDADFTYLARVLAQSPYTDAQLAAIYQAEVEPVCESNVSMVPGYWSGFPDGWVEAAILSRGLDATRVLADLRATSKSIAWGWRGLQQRVLEQRRLRDAHDEL